MVVPDDRRAWFDGSRTVQVLGVDELGRYTSAGLPPGRYYVAAVSRPEEADLSDPQFLERLTSMGVAFEIATGQDRVVDVQVAR